MKITYCTPSLYIAGGIERVLTTKMNYLADEAGYDVWVILTDGKGKEPYFKLSDKVHVVNLDVNFEELWSLGFLAKIPVYLKKQRIYKKRLKQALFDIRPDVTITTLRREINFITSIKDGSKKIGEMHINRANYRNFSGKDSSFLKTIFADYWMRNLIGKLKKLDSFVVLTEKDMNSWRELDKVLCIPNPISDTNKIVSTQTSKNVIAVGRYCHEKGFDNLIKAWKFVEMKHPDWTLNIYGSGNQDEYISLIKKENLTSCKLHDAVSNIFEMYSNSSIFALSSRFEGFGMVIVEAMSCGIPPVAFDCPWGPRQIITDGKDGILVENGNVQDFADKICYLIENEDIRKNMARNAVEKAKLYSVDAIMKKWLDLFESINQ